MRPVESGRGVVAVPSAARIDDQLTADILAYLLHELT
jgi:hypothetical protein